MLSPWYRFIPLTLALAGASALSAIGQSSQPPQPQTSQVQVHQSQVQESRVTQSQLNQRLLQQGQTQQRSAPQGQPQQRSVTQGQGQQTQAPKTEIDYQQQIQSGMMTPEQMQGAFSAGRIEASVMSMEQYGRNQNRLGQQFHQDAEARFDSQVIESAVVERRVMFSQEHDQSRQRFLRARPSQIHEDAGDPFDDRPVRTAALDERPHADAKGNVDFDKLNRNVFRRNRPSDPDDGSVPVQRAGGDGSE